MVSARLSRIGRVEVSPLVQGSIDHQLEALLRGRELRDVVTRVGSSDMLLHGAIAFLLHDDVPGQMLTIPLFLFLLSFFFFLLTAPRALQELGEAVPLGARRRRSGDGRRHSPPSIVSGNWSHHCWSTGRRPRCWHRRQRKSWSGKLVVAWSACISLSLLLRGGGEEEQEEGEWITGRAAEHTSNASGLRLGDLTRR